MHTADLCEQEKLDWTCVYSLSLIAGKVTVTPALVPGGFWASVPERLPGALGCCGSLQQREL